MQTGCKNLFIVPAGGYGTRLLPLTKNQAKPSLPIGCSKDGKIVRMLDVSLNVAQSLGFQTIVSTSYKSKTLSYLGNEGKIVLSYTVTPELPIATAIRNIEVIKKLKPDKICILPADSFVAPIHISNLIDKVDSKVKASVLATNYLDGHNKWPVDQNNYFDTSARSTQWIADLGIHVFDFDWFLYMTRRLQASNESDIWADYYLNSESPTILFVPDTALHNVDIGTPQAYYSALSIMNSNKIDSMGNIIFPGAKVHEKSKNVIALPNSVSDNIILSNAIIPENESNVSLADILKIDINEFTIFSDLVMSICQIE